MEPLEVHPRKMHDPAPGEETTIGPRTHYRWPAGEELCRGGTRGPAGHHVEHEPARTAKDLLGCTKRRIGRRLREGISTDDNNKMARSTSSDPKRSDQEKCNYVYTSY